MQKTYESIINAIGNTPLVEIRSLNPAGDRVKIFAKMESFNPGGSIKDRTALYMISGAEKRGDLTKDKIILEATSGNTGIGMALIAAAKGYRLYLAMPESASEERKKILKAMGAELFFTPANLGTDGSIELVYNMMRENPDRYFVPDQFNNTDNILAHYEGTGEEIWRQTDGGVTMVVSSLGTTGTAMGISRRLKEYNPAIRIVGVEPYMQHKIQGLKNMKESYRPGIFDKNRLDEKINIHDEDAFEIARKLARKEGLLAGMSSGAALYVALQKAKELTSGLIVVIFPDSGERYLSTELFVEKGQSSLRIYNTLTREKAYFRPIHEEEVLIHSCGPTVHEVPHLGHYRRFVASDMMNRYLDSKGYKVTHSMDIIDLDDRSVKSAEAAGMDLGAYTDRCAAKFFRDMDTLNIKSCNSFPRASDNVDAMIALVEKLVAAGGAYEKLRSVYFDISKLRDYGRLSNVDLGQMKQGRTVDADYYEKDSPVDFTLFKRATLSELKRGVYFKTRWGNVRPSWHLECAAISMKHLADSFDIHISGSDILFPHCENVMAIGKALTGKPMANYWMNIEILMAGSQKMSRSLNNVLTIEDLEKKGYGGPDIRFFLLGTHYRKPLNFSFGALDTAKNTIKKLNGFIQRLIHSSSGAGYADTDQLIYDVNQGFNDAMDDDFNISGALAVLFEFVKKVGLPLDQGKLKNEEKDSILSVMKKIDGTLGVMRFEEEMISQDVKRLIAEREALRKTRQWEKADEIRVRLAQTGIDISDTPHGVVWRKK
ncbi:MAG: cysteine--tRNA ligase [Deltaproteobacteria bacterium]|nr:cysteine--tRNA ligase [Deltaproteobacteria bacterium]